MKVSRKSTHADGLPLKASPNLLTSSTQGTNEAQLRKDLLLGPLCQQLPLPAPQASWVSVCGGLQPRHPGNRPPWGVRRHAAPSAGMIELFFPRGRQVVEQETKDSDWKKRKKKRFRSCGGKGCRDLLHLTARNRGRPRERRLICVSFQPPSPRWQIFAHIAK